MSIGRIGTRAALVAVGVLASVVFMAAPSWAAKGNSANAKLCEAGGYPGVLFNQQGETFKNEGACTKYAAKGGQLIGLDAVAEPAVLGVSLVICSGFGLEPGSPLFTCSIKREAGASNPSATVGPDGTVSITVGVACTVEVGGKVTGIEPVAAVPGAQLKALFPPPSGC
jgi:hypothetical protein